MLRKKSSQTTLLIKKHFIANNFSRISREGTKSEKAVLTRNPFLRGSGDKMQFGKNRKERRYSKKETKWRMQQLMLTGSVS
jgi:hypothetical protein